MIRYAVMTQLLSAKSSRSFVMDTKAVLTIVTSKLTRKIQRKSLWVWRPLDSSPDGYSRVGVEKM